MMRSQLRIPTRLVDRNRPRIGGEPPQPPPSPPPAPTRDEITPSSGWTQDSNSHYLLLELPDFKLVDIKMQIEIPDRVKISGERKAGEKIIFFDKTYIVPDNADVEKISFKLDGGTFTVTFPKRLPPPPVQEVISSEEKSTAKDANSLPDVGDLETQSDGEDDKLKDEKHQQQKNEKSTDDLKKESDGKDENLEDQEQQQQLETETMSSCAEEKQKRSSSREKNPFNNAAQMICKSKNTIFISLIAFSLGVLISRKMGH